MHAALVVVGKRSGKKRIRTLIRTVQRFVSLMREAVNIDDCPIHQATNKECSFTV